MKKLILGLAAVVLVAFPYYVCADEPDVRDFGEGQCSSDSQFTGKEYSVKKSYALRKYPKSDSPKIENWPTATMKGIDDEFRYRNVDRSTIVYEECKKDDWSFIKVISPDWLSDTHRGWIDSTILVGMSTDTDKSGLTKYELAIPEYILEEYNEKDYPGLKNSDIFKLRRSDIEKFRRKAAEMAVDAESCKQVTDSQLATSSRIDSIVIRVDCINRKQFYFTEQEIKGRKK
jgi:hypothetical protein